MYLRRGFLFLLFSILGFGSLQLLAANQIKTIVIDPGHGGKDSGAVGKFCKEKDIVLSVALALGEKIQENYPDIKVIYTRKDDRFVTLVQRTQIANQNNSDFFISIHCNAAENRAAKGHETWVIGNHKTAANLKVAQMENSVILKEQNYEENYQNFDPNSPDAYIVFSLFQNAFIDQSLSLASFIQNRYQSHNPRTPNRGIHQAGFLVLWRCARPSVLTEIGFISNTEEEKFLASKEGQASIVDALFLAIKDYKESLEGLITAADADSVQTVADTPAPQADTTESVPASQTDNLISERGAEAFQSPQPIAVLKVQFASGSTLRQAQEFPQVPDVSYYFENNIYKYCSGHFTDLESAKKHLDKIKDLGYKDAFIVGFINQERNSLEEVLKKL